VKSLTFALDFDDTLTADPRLWAIFVTAARASGHRVWLVTARRDTEENHQIIDEWLEHWGHNLPVLFTNLGSKLAAVERQGIRIDIWIDDDHTSLVHGH